MSVGLFSGGNEYAVLFVGNSNRGYIAKWVICKHKNLGGAGVKEKDLKLVLAGVTVVTTMLKIIIQHRGQMRKGKNHV